MIHPSRRAFLRSLLALPIAATVDLEQLLWTPSPMIVVPALRTGVTLEEINRITLATIYPGIVDHFFRASPLVDYLRTEGVMATVQAGTRVQAGTFVYRADGSVYGVAEEDGSAGDRVPVVRRGMAQVRVV